MRWGRSESRLAANERRAEVSHVSCKLHRGIRGYTGSRLAAGWRLQQTRPAGKPRICETPARRCRGAIEGRWLGWARLLAATSSLAAPGGRASSAGG